MRTYCTISLINFQKKLNRTIKMFVLLLLCITHDVASNLFRENNGMNRALVKPKYSNEYDGIYRNILKYVANSEYYKDVDYNDVLNELENRRLFDWLKNIIKRNTTAKTTPTYDNIRNEQIRFRDIERNLTVTLTQLSYVLQQIFNIIKYSRQDDIHDINDYLQQTLGKNKHISKRNVDDKDIETNRTIDNDYKITNMDNNKSQDFNYTSGRRALMGSMIPVANDDVKNKLFSYIEEDFLEIGNNINSLKPIKNMLSKDIRYKIGYIIANIDTLDANMRNLKINMATNKYTWSDKKILNVYDTVKISNRVVNNLLEVLKGYMESQLIS